MSLFTESRLGLDLYQRPDGRAILRGGRAQWLTDGELPYEVGAVGSGEWVIVPAQFLTDLASVPRLASVLFPPDGPWLKAAVLHDYLYATKGLQGRYTRGQCDVIFKDAMKALGVSKFDRNVIYSAVVVGGWKGWGS